MTVTKNLKTKYQEDVVPALKEKFGYKNEHQVPKLVKVVLNMGVGEASHNSKIAEAIEAQLTKIAGQKAVVTKAKKAYIQAIQDHNLIIPATEIDLKYCLIAIRAMEPTQVAKNKDYILNVLYEIYSTYFNSQPFSSIKSEFRYTLCWVDEALYLDR